MAYKDLTFRDFNGGLNLRDSASELSPDEFPVAMNVTIDERGYVQKRLGYVNRFGSALGSGLTSNIFSWATRGQIVEQVGTQLFLENGAAFHTFSTADRCAMCEFGGNLFYTHPIDGGYLYSGSGSPTAVASAPKGNVAATWQNKVWANDITTPARWWRSDAGTPGTWGVTSYIDIREKDSAKLTCAAGASGIDIAGRPGLLVFKDSSAYRINDPTTGSYTTIDSSVGCGSSLGAVTAYGRTYVISPRGIYSTDGLNPMREDSRLINPLFTKTQTNADRGDLYAAGRRGDRLYFSVPRAGQTANTLAIELNPQENWFTLRTDAASAYASIGPEMVIGSPSVAGRIYDANQTGSDAGVDITSQFQTRWAEPADGKLSRLRSARVVGSGAWQADVFKDYSDGASQAALMVDIESGGMIWNEDNWNEAEWGPIFFQGYQDFYSLGTARSVSIMINETSSLTSSGHSIAGGPAPIKGAWTMAYFSILTIDLGMK